MPNSDPWDRFVHPYLTLMSESYSISHQHCVIGQNFRRLCSNLEETGPSDYESEIVKKAEVKRKLGKV